jgi:Domain of unknown function (DUF4388)
MPFGDIASGVGLGQGVVGHIHDGIRRPMSSFTPWEAETVSQLDSSGQALEAGRLVVVVADGNARRCSQLAEWVRNLGVRDVAEVHRLEPALERLRQQPTDVLICGERLLDHDAAVLVAAVRRVSPATRTLLLPDDEALNAAAPESYDAPDASPMQALLKMALHDAVAAQGAFWCKVPDLSLPDILQLYHQLRRSVTVLVSGRIAGRIRLEFGELVHAESDDHLGTAALCRLLEANSGLVRTDTSPFDGVQTISGRFHRVLLDTMDLLDARRQVHEADATSSQAELEPTPPEKPPLDEAVGLVGSAPFVARRASRTSLRTVSLISVGGLAAAVLLYALMTNRAVSADPMPPAVVRYAAEPMPALAGLVDNSRPLEPEKPAAAATSVSHGSSSVDPSIPPTALGAAVLEDANVGATPSRSAPSMSAPGVSAPSVSAPRPPPPEPHVPSSVGARPQAPAPGAGALDIRLER